MNIRISASIVLWLAVVFSTNVMAADIAIYRWVDENNVVHFSQHQPQNNNYSQLTTFTSYKAKAKENPLPAQSAKQPSVDEQLAQYEKEKAEVAAKNKEINEKNCQAARLNEKMLNSFDSVMTTDNDGKNRALTDKEKKAQLALSKEHIDTYCDK